MDRKVPSSTLQRDCRQQQSSEEAAQVKSQTPAWLTLGPGHGCHHLSVLQLVKGVEIPCRPRGKKKAGGKEARGRQEWWVAEIPLFCFFVSLF